MKNSLLVLLVLFGAVMSMQSQKSSPPSPRSGQGPIGAGRVGAGAVSQNWKVAPDLDARLAKYRRVRMPFNAARFNARERQMIDKLVEASQYLENIFWRQNDPESLTLYHQLEGSTNPQDQKLRELLFLNAGRFDLLDNDRPFVGTEPMSPGRGLYSPGLTREQIEAHVQQHPDQKDAIYSPYTVVRQHGQDLETFPYRVEYRAFLEPAARALREAAALSADPDFAKFLQLRAKALLTDDYYTSDLAWVDLKNPKFDVIFAPYETYLDGVLGVKTSYGAAVLVRNQAESQKLAEFQKYVADIQEALPLPPEDRPSKRGLQMPMEVVDAIFRAGDLHHGYQAVADNLPNDPKIQKEKGTKKIFFKNFMDARVNDIILPLARRTMRPDQAALASGEGYLAHTLMHEISHGIGPAFARVNGKEVDIREAIGPVYSGLEEAKADVVGMFALLWLMDHGHLPQRERTGYYASYVAGIFRTVRFGIAEAHGRAEMMEFNYLQEQGVIVRDPATGRYSIVNDKMDGAIRSLAKELLEQEATGDRARTEAWFAKYSSMPPELRELLDRQKDIPVDLAPTFAFPFKIR